MVRDFSRVNTLLSSSCCTAPPILILVGEAFGYALALSHIDLALKSQQYPVRVGDLSSLYCPLYSSAYTLSSFFKEVNCCKRWVGAFW
jgi:hypothetical protein